jgi:hypothetical protein
LGKKPLFAAFVDLTKAFPSMNRDKMFSFLVEKGAPTDLINAIRAFYVGNRARLRVDNLLSTCINVTLGVLEGSVLSPSLFSCVFSVIWEFISTTDFPSSQPRVLRIGAIWLIAFADDLVILSTDHERLNEVLSHLFSVLKDFNLVMSLIKTETMTFSPPSTRSVSSLSLQLAGSVLKHVDRFKYLGISVCSRWSLRGHVDLMTRRAEAAAAELHNIITRLEISDISRLTTYYRALVESQWHGLELLPVRVVDDMERVRLNFIRRRYSLPRCTAKAICFVIFDLWPPAYECLLRRFTFFQSLTTHDLTFVRNCLLFDRACLLKDRQGWYYDSFLIYQSLFVNATLPAFDFEANMSRLQAINRSRHDFLFLMLSSTDEVTMEPFRCFRSPATLSSFRGMLGKISLSSASLILSFCSSGMRFRFFNRSAVTCPACRRVSWLTKHMFECPVVGSILARNGIDYTSFCASIRDGKWDVMITLIHETLTTWKSWAVFCEIPEDELNRLFCDRRLAI